jgi:hypothetical protein
LKKPATRTTPILDAHCGHHNTTEKNMRNLSWFLLTNKVNSQSTCGHHNMTENLRNVMVTCCLNPSFGHTISPVFFSDSSASAHGLLPLQTELHLETPKLVKKHQKQHTEEAYQDMHDCGEKKKSNALSIVKCSFFIYAVTTAPLRETPAKQ